MELPPFFLTIMYRSNMRISDTSASLATTAPVSDVVNLYETFIGPFTLC